MSWLGFAGQKIGHLEDAGDLFDAALLLSPSAVFALRNPKPMFLRTVMCG